MNITFNHEAETLPNSININTEELIYTKKALIFSILSPRVMSEMYYDDPDDAPSNMTTTSGRLELGLSLLNKDNMKFYYLYNYKDIYTKLTGMYMAYKNPDILKNLIKEDLDDINIALKNLIMHIKIKPVKDIVESIEKSNGNFLNFLENTKNLLIFDEDGDLLNKEEEE
jgi:hypothetical protein